MAMPAMSGHGHGDHDRQDAPKGAAAKHECIGCIAPFTARHRPSEPAPLPALRLKLLNQTQIAAVHTAPDTPPPRA
ncbi:MAG: hypothetical protein QM676_11080 [Novosphingobium sp.]